jgi:hypothetical protein
MSSIVPSPPQTATTTQRGLMSAADKAKLDGLGGAGHDPVTVSSPAGWLSLVAQALTFALVSASATVAGVVDTAAQTIAGIKTLTSTLIASAGIQVGSLWNTNGAGASDVVLKVGTTAADASVNAAAKLLSVRTGIGATEVESFYFTKALLYFGGSGVFSIEKDLVGGLGIKTSSTAIFTWLPSGIARSGYGFDLNPAWGAYLSFQVVSSGLVNQRGTDSTGTPGAATIDRPIGKSSIAAAASSVVITNNLVTALSHIVITPMENGTSNAEFRNFKVTPAAGSFTVTVNAATTVAWPFAWRVATILTA